MIRMIMFYCFLSLISFLSNCSDKEKALNPQLPISPDTPLVAISTVDWNTGGAGAVVTYYNGMVSASQSVVADNSVRPIHGRFFVLGRMGSSSLYELKIPLTTVVGPSNNILAQTALGDPSINPVDIDSVAPDKFYISCQNASFFLSGKPGNFHPIDLSRFANPGNSTHQVMGEQIAVANGFAFLALGRGKMVGNNAVFDSTGLILQIDCTTDSVIRTFHLSTHNPNAVCVSGNFLYVSTRGIWDGATFSYDKSGAVERIDLTTFAIETILTCTDIGNSVFNFENLVLAENGYAYLQCPQTWPNCGVAKIDLGKKGAGALVRMLPGLVQAGGGLAYDKVSKRLYVGEQLSTASGLMVYDASGSTEIPIFTKPVPTGMPPYEIRLIEK